ncbi:MAG: M16 family metallopeptidase, partial [Candidatus Hydrothermarchaeales archaeon]
MKRTAILLILIALSGCIARPPAMGEAEKVILENGMTLIVKENRANDIVAVEVFVKTGAWTEPEGETGIRNFVGKMLLKGTKKRSARDIAFESEAVGVTLSTDIGNDYTEITMKSTGEFFEEGMEILADIITNSIFAPDEIEKERGIILEEIKAQEDNAFQNIHALFLKTLYGEHPYGKSLIGDAEAVKVMDRESLLGYYGKYYVPNNIVVAIVGNVEAERAISVVEDQFKGFEYGEIPKRPEIEAEISETYGSEEKEREQSYIMVGYLCADIKSEDYPVLKVINSILGEGSSSRLFVELREKRGLAYEVVSFFPSRMDRSYIVAFIGTTPENEKEVISGIEEEFDSLKEELVTEEELERAKKRLAGNYVMRHESNKGQARYLAFFESLGVGYGYDERYIEEVEGVTQEDIQRVARKYFEKPVVVVVG